MDFKPGKTYLDREGNEYLYVGLNPVPDGTRPDGRALIFVRPDGAVVTRNRNGVAASGLAKYDIIEKKKNLVTRYVASYLNTKGHRCLGDLLFETEQGCRSWYVASVLSGFTVATVTFEE